jgi:hypothetical protein
MAAEAGAEWRWGHRLERCVGRDNGWRLEWSSDDDAKGRREPARRHGTLDVDFVADATGRVARLARRLGATRVRYDRLVGVATLLASHTPTADTYTLVEAVRDGWWYSALLSDGRLAVAFLSDGDLVRRALFGARGGPRAWWQHLQHTSATVERVERNGYGPPARCASCPRRARGLTSSRDRWIAIGMPPRPSILSSQGRVRRSLLGGHAIVDLLAGRDEACLRTCIYSRTPTAPISVQREHYGSEVTADGLLGRRARSYGVVPLDASSAASGDPA